MTSNPASTEDTPTVQGVTGKSREPYVTETITDYRGRALADVERFPSFQVATVLDRNRTTGQKELDDIDIGELTTTLQRAGRHFAENELGPNATGPEEYIKNVVRATGLPLTTVRSAIETIRQAFEQAEQTLRAQAPNAELSVFDDRQYKSSDGTAVGYVPKGDNLGLLAPSNHPAVLALALVAYAMKYPLAIRPSTGEPFTPARIVYALHRAGVPAESVVFLPGDREVGTKVLKRSDVAIGFGGDQLHQQYASEHDVKIHGPGNSKVFVDTDYVGKQRTVERLEEAMMADGGRGCINMSQIITTGDADSLADRLAKRVANTPIRSPLEETARIPAVPDSERATQLDELVTNRLLSSGAEDITERHDPRPRVIERDGVKYLRPTVVRLNWDEFHSGTHDLFQELPFQYASIVSVPEDDIVTALSDSLAVTLLSDSGGLESQTLREPSIEKLYANGELTCDIDLREPHEGYLSDFLFRKQAYRPS